MTNKTVGPFFHQKIITEAIYQDMLERFFIPQLQDIQNIFQKHGTPLH